MSGELDEKHRAYLNLIIEERETKNIGWREAQKRVREYDEEELIEHGIDGSYAERPRDLEYLITEKADNIPDRVESLAEDIELLQEAGFWGPHWEELLDVNPDEDVDFRLGADMLECESPQEEFGRKLGKMIEGMFTMFPKTEQVNPHTFRYGLIRGFITGFYQSTVFDIDEIPIDSDIYKVPNTLQEDMETVKRNAREPFLGLESFFSSGKIPLWFLRLDQQIDGYIRDALQGLGCNVTDHLVYYVRETLEEEHHGVNLSAAAVMENPSYVAEDNPSEKKRLLFKYVQREYAPPSKLRKLVDETDLETLATIEKSVCDDLSRLFEMGGPQALRIILVASEKGTTVNRISDATGLEKSDVGRYVQYLAGEDVEWTDPWESYAVVSNEENGGYFGNWCVSLTPYGRVIEKNLTHDLIDRVEVMQEEEHKVDNQHPWGTPSSIGVPNSLLTEVVDQITSSESLKSD